MDLTPEGAGCIGAAPEHDSLRGQPGPVRVLVVDDDVEIRQMFAEYLHTEGFEVSEASDGIEALRTIAQSCPDAVVLDIMMPRLGGLRTLKRIRAWDPKVRVIVVSGVADADLQRQTILAGATGVLLKPVEMPDLAAAVRGDPLGPCDDAASATPSSPPSAGRVLIVDADSAVRQIFAEYLVEKGYDVQTAAGGLSALETLGTAPPDVVLLDIQMHGPTGMAILGILRTLVPTAQVIMVSGATTFELAQEALACGAFDYLSKPVDLVHLVRSVEAAVFLKRFDEACWLAPRTASDVSVPRSPFA